MSKKAADLFRACLVVLDNIVPRIESGKSRVVMTEFCERCRAALPPNRGDTFCDHCREEMADEGDDGDERWQED